MATFTESDTIETLSSEQLEMMSKTDHSWLIDYIASATRFDAHRIRLMLEFGQDAVKRKMEGL
ncbi:hypothetical protein [Zhongshania sp.]|uniref:hypothetical protein n=1 Tax=Zhongshania sp. TaxID=1971902 RepID=UPI002A7F2BF5|nr:hypothetical protein [Zhongshania sp.]